MLNDVALDSDGVVGLVWRPLEAFWKHPQAPRNSQRSFLELLVASSSSWELLEASGSFLELLGSFWELLVASNSSWELLEAPGEVWGSFFF